MAPASVPAGAPALTSLKDWLSVSVSPQQQKAKKNTVLIINTKTLF